jgi:hypothetical protein
MTLVSDGTLHRLAAERWGRWLSRDQAIAYLGLSSKHALYRLVRQGLPTFKFGESPKAGLKFDRLRLDAWAEEHRVQVYEPRLRRAA